MTARVAVPSKGRLREEVVRLLAEAGYDVSGLRGRGSTARLDGLDLIEMRPKDAAAALAAEALDGAFIATDIALECGIDSLPRQQLGFARSDLIVAARDEDGHGSLADLAGAVVATHMPNLTQRHFDAAGVEVRVMAMGGSLEGVCAAGIADAIVDNSETGTSLRQNHLSQVDLIAECQAEFVHRPGVALLADLELRLGAVLAARGHRYVMLHLAEDQVPALVEMFAGLESPTVLPLAGRDDRVAVHFVAKRGELWARLADLRTLGATGIVALPPGALLP